MRRRGRFAEGSRVTAARRALLRMGGEWRALAAAERAMARWVLFSAATAVQVEESTSPVALAAIEQAAPTACESTACLQGRPARLAGAAGAGGARAALGAGA